MANEIKVSASLRLVNSYLRISKSAALTLDQTTVGGGQPGTVSCTTTDTAISISGVTTPKWCWLRNLGTNPVRVGPTSGGAIVPMVQLGEGECALLPLSPSVALRQQTTTGTSILEVVVLET